MPDIGQCEILRNNYGYPPARLVRQLTPTPNTITWIGRHYQRMDPPPDLDAPGAGYASRTLDSYHSGLLNSAIPDQNVDGVMSIVYWGHFAGQDGTVTHLAESRAKCVLLGRRTRNQQLTAPSTVAEIQGTVTNARALIHAGNYQNARAAIDNIVFIDLSFASKVIAFMDPDHCGVLDKIVGGKLRNSASPILNTINVKRDYQRFCDFCSDRAQMLNTAGSTWTDWDGAHCIWRAIDVERVIFASPGDPGPILI